MDQIEEDDSDMEEVDVPEEEVADLLASDPDSPQSPKGEKEKPKKDEVW